MLPRERVQLGERSPAPVGGPVAESVRVRLARLALSAALSQSGVAGADSVALGVHVTQAGRGERLKGVISAAEGARRFAISLRLVAELVNLEELAASIRVAVRDIAAREGLACRLGDVHVHFADGVAGRQPR